MKIVAISDTHTRHRDITLPEGDILVHLGDYCDGLRPHPDFEGLHEQLVDAREWLLSQKHRYKAIICLPGNHDPVSALMTLSVEGITLLDNDSTEIEGLRIAGITMSKAPTFGRWQKEDHDIAKDIRGLPSSVDVVLSHCPPYDMLDRSSSGFSVGSKAIRDYVERACPRYHLFGHCHNTAGLQVTKGGTTYVNAGIPKTEGGLGGPVIVQINT